MYILFQLERSCLYSLLGGFGGFLGFLLGGSIALSYFGHIDRLGEGYVVDQPGTLQVGVTLVSEHVGVETELRYKLFSKV
jgi:hypothetical protein